jgi:hypothetical protein
MSSSALQNVVKGLTTMVEQHCDVKKAGVKDNSIYCLPDNTVD